MSIVGEDTTVTVINVGKGSLVNLHKDFCQFMGVFLKEL
jgi:hypothetical protein